MIRHKLIKILKSSQFLTLCVIIVIFGFFSTYIFRFPDDISRQSDTLDAIQSTQEKVQDLQNSIIVLKDNNERLVRIVCTLQKQVEALGAKPVESIEECHFN